MKAIYNKSSFLYASGKWHIFIFSNTEQIVNFISKVMPMYEFCSPIQA